MQELDKTELLQFEEEFTTILRLKEKLRRMFAVNFLNDVL